MSEMESLLKCEIDGVECITEQLVFLHLPKGHCTDMEGAIKLAQMFRPEVTAIHTFAGNKLDTVYFKREHGWIASPAPRENMTE